MTPEATGPESLRDRMIDALIILDTPAEVASAAIAHARQFSTHLLRDATRRVDAILALLPPTVQEDARVEQIITILRDTLFVQHGMEDGHHVFGVDGIGEAALAIARSGSGGTGQ